MRLWNPIEFNNGSKRVHQSRVSKTSMLGWLGCWLFLILYLVQRSVFCQIEQNEYYVTHFFSSLSSITLSNGVNKQILFFFKQTNENIFEISWDHHSSIAHCMYIFKWTHVLRFNSLIKIKVKIKLDLFLFPNIFPRWAGSCFAFKCGVCIN